MASQAALGNVDFSGLVLGLCSAALSYMGFDEKGTSKNLELAKQNIEILDILLLKTKGNLTEEESQLLSSVVRDLKIKYSEISQ